MASRRRGYDDESDRPRISIIIPVRDEYDALCRHLPWLQPLRGEGNEIILVDGGSRDGGPRAVIELVDQSLKSAPGRACQMNAGAEAARGAFLLFLHIDTLLPENACELIQEALREPDRPWGRFDVRLSGSRPAFRRIATWMNRRSRWTGVATGDQALFMTREVFQRVGGYPDIPLMEDVALSKRLRKQARPVCLDTPVITSSRRWERNGVLRTVLLMWWLRLLFALGVNPRRLHHLYYRQRHPGTGEARE